MIVALNNKCNLKKDEYLEYINQLDSISSSSQLIICPTFLNVGMKEVHNVKLGAQNVSTKEQGAHTGEVSSDQLKSYGVQYTIVGHSERRESQKETNAEVHEKLVRLFEQDITPILCIGESLEERQANQVEKVLEEELTTAIEGLTEEQKERLIIAYEPIWAIGTGVIPTNEEIRDVFLFIKKYLPTSKILYGGSANDENIDTLKEIKEIDGYLLGGLSLKIEKLKVFLSKCE